jgi:alkanesulfonate monooxygenase SsuD/methylene tetrahydromethanopterin reductase-like flavin-dependent oxidoreductase (luciferase family)
LKIGIALESFTPPGKNPSIESIFRMSETAESLGFESVWVWDHLLLGSRRVYPVLDSLSTLAAIGARTQRIKLGTGVLILGLRNPVVVSKVISTIHYMTGGRLVIGSAAGWYEKEFHATGVEFNKRGKVFEERFLLVKKLISEADVTYKSAPFEISHASMEPRSPLPVPMLMGGYAEAALSRAGRLSDGWICYYYRAEDFAKSWKIVEEAASKNGRSAQSLERVNIVPVAVSENREEGMKKAEDFTRRYMDLPKNTFCTPQSAIVGSVGDCVEQIENYVQAGVQRLVLIPSDYDLKQVETVGREILHSF